MPRYIRSCGPGNKYFFTVVTHRRRPILTLPEGDQDYPRRWNVIKTTFSKLMKEQLDSGRSDNASRTKHRELGIWQRRYWEHQIRDPTDLHRHYDYIHINPVKHGLVIRAGDWPYSTFHRFVAEGIYASDWATAGDPENDGAFGE